MFDVLFDPIEVIQRILISFLMGFLIGLERESRGARRFMIAGVRTFPIISIAGTASLIISQEMGEPLIVAIGFMFALAISIIIAYVHYSLGVPGLTTSAIAFATYLIGVIVGLGHIEIAAVITVMIVLLGLERQFFKNIAENVSQSELIEALEFLVIALIIFPLLPQEKIYGFIDLRWLFYIIIVISIISFISFVAMRVIGVRKGTIFSALLGGLVNSEATTTSLLIRTKGEKKLRGLITSAICVTNSTMLVRNIIIVGLSVASFSKFIEHYAMLLLPSIWVSILISYHYSKKIERGIKITPEIESPLGLKNAVKFSLVFFGIYLVTYFISKYFSGAVYLIALGGLVSAAAVVSSVAVMTANGVLALKTGVITAVVATLVSYADKVIYTYIIEKGFTKDVAIAITLGVLPSVGVLLAYYLIL